jgi:hypothetical protein
MSRNVSQFERHAAPPDDGWARLSQIEPGPATAPETQSTPVPTTAATTNAGASAGPAGAPPAMESPAVANAGHTILDDSPIVPRWTRSSADSPPGTDESSASVDSASGSRAVTRFVVVFLLAIHAGLLAWQAYRYSPTIDEPAHMAAGISHWKFGRFDLYRVNPPLVRMVAALPMLVVNPKVDWSAFTEAPYARPEFAIGSALANGNGFDIFWDFTLARWACIPFSLIGGYFCYRWGRELYGVRSGIVALVLWCFCPNILGNGALITPDVPAAALGVTACYFFWRWLKAPGWPAALVAGLTLGLAELTKSTWIILFALYPAMWFVWAVCQRRRNPEAVEGQSSQPGDWLGFPRRFLRLPLRFWGSFRQQPGTCACPPSLGSERLPASGQTGRGQNDGDPTDNDFSIADSKPGVRYPRYVAQLALILTLALYLLNLGYGFENTFQPLGKFAFISRTLGGPEAHEKPGNRFAGTWLASIPVPVPANYLRGIDVQKYDFEKGKWSYLRGEHKFGGWWYYYLYAMAVKMPAGTLALIGIACVFPLTGLRRHPACDSAENSNNRSASRRSAIRGPESAIVLLLPAFLVLILISSQTGFSRYLRYALPAFPFLFLFASGLAGAIPQQWKGAQGGSLRIRGALTHAATPLLLLASATSSLAVFPHSLSYFNEVAGGPLTGHAWLLDCNIDWGQDLSYLNTLCHTYPDSTPKYCAYSGPLDVRIACLDCESLPAVLRTAQWATSMAATAPQRLAGCCAISVNALNAYCTHGPEQDDYAYLRGHKPSGHAGYSIRLYKVPFND